MLALEMSDARLRQLQRYASRGDHSAHVRLLQERVRCGELGEDRLRLASQLGHEAACMLAASQGLDRRVLLDDWIALFAPWGEEALGRMLVVTARVALDVLQDESPRLQETWLPVVEGLEEWVLCPCPEHLGGLPRGDPWQRGVSRRSGVPIAHRALQLVERAVRVLAGQGPSSALEHVTSAVYLASKARTGMREAIALELVPWALALGDPLLERVTARRTAGA